MFTRPQLQEIIEKYAEQLHRPGVIEVRAGYRCRAGKMSDEPAIVVTVQQKKHPEKLSSDEMLPKELDGVPVDVTPATPLQQLMTTRQAQDLASDTLPAETDSISVRSGTSSTTQSKDNIRYQAPNGFTLDSITGEMTLTCCVSPEAGWPVLKDFLEQTKNNLTVAIYDVTAPHIEQAILNAMSASHILAMIADSCADRQSSGDISEDSIVSNLQNALGNRMTFDWAPVPTHHRTTEVLFPTAYHIKVAVRDSEAFWLSSGNWDSTNQPNVTLSVVPEGGFAKFLAQHDRDWHIVVENPALAKTFEAYIKHDMEQAEPLQVTAPPAMAATDQLSAETQPNLYVRDISCAVSTASLRFFPQAIFKPADCGAITIQPLLTPDSGSYLNYIIDLVGKAQHTLYIQNQYINIHANEESQFSQLVDLVAQKIKAGLDVRIILRTMQTDPKSNTRKMLEQLIDRGIPTRCIKLQLGCHNKAVLVDSQIVAVGSHNWSHDGTLENRDASLIIYNENVTAYYQQIFLYDWNRLPECTLQEEQAMPVAKLPGVEQPAGTAEVTWSSVYGRHGVTPALVA